MKYLLNLIYVGLLIVLSPWLAWAAFRKGKYREGWSAKFLGQVPAPLSAKSPRIWFHAVSVGEVNLLSPILNELLAALPDANILITTTTKTGFQLACQNYARHTVSYGPLDFSWAVERTLNMWRPDMLVLIELELWPNLLLAARQRSIPVAIVNARMSDASTAGYLRLRSMLPNLTAHVLQAIHLVAAQSRPCAERFEQVGINPARVFYTGSIKFDGAQTERDNPLSRQLRELANIQPHDRLFVAGSTQAPEEAYALSVLQSLSDDYPKLRLILVPRHPERASEVAQMLDSSGLAWCRRTEIGPGIPMTDQRILLVDVVGELGGWWGCADIGFVGGSMGKRGGQNMLEPSGFGVATSFGPNTRNFRDVVAQLLAADAAVVVQDKEDLLEFVRKCLQDTKYRETLGTRAQHVVKSQRGATKATVRLLLELIRPLQPASDEANASWRRSA